MKDLIYISLIVVAFLLGIYLVDDSFSEKDRYLSWNYDYFQEIKAQQRCLYFAYPAEQEGSTWLKKLFCLPKQYPL